VNEKAARPSESAQEKASPDCGKAALDEREDRGRDPWRGAAVQPASTLCG
jgi:hypothetical protein